MSIIKATQQLEYIFDKFNETYYNNSLLKPVIIIGSDPKGKKFGHCTVGKVWNKSNDVKLYEIMISAEFLNRKTVEICGTLLHEMVHLDNTAKDIKDTSNNYSYHNNKFKQTAEKVGLNVEKGKYGWHITSLNDANIELIKTFNIDESAFDIYRTLFIKKDVASTIGVSYKYLCPSCENKFTFRKQMNLICGDCNCAYGVEEK